MQFILIILLTLHLPLFAQQRICQTADSVQFTTLKLTQSDERVIEVRNCGGGNLRLNEVGALTNSPHFLIGGDCQSGLTLASEQTCTLTVRYQPQSLGNHSIAIKLYNNSPTPTQFLTAYGKAVSADTVAAVEFFNSSLDHYFITAATAEIEAIERGDAGPNWRRTGQRFLVRTSSLGTSPMCRFYGTLVYGPNSHFYTADAAECAELKRLYRPNQSSWTYEGIAFYVNTSLVGCASTQQVRRLYNQGFPKKDSNHRYTTSAAIAAAMSALGWRDEGVVFCAE